MVRLTVLNFSGGTGSTAILEMVLRGEIERPGDFLVLNADPGMESAGTYREVQAMAEKCSRAGIDFATVPGPSLYRDLVGLRKSGASRIDNPPYWTQGADGSLGQLSQKCTRHYKIAPMDRYIRSVLERRFGISASAKRIGAGIVEKWIGFTLDEEIRVKPSERKYIRYRYPLIEARLTKSELPWERWGRKPPTRSVCNACFANSFGFFATMAESEPGDFAQACDVDDAVRDMSSVGVRDRVFVSKKLVPLRELDFSRPEPGQLDLWGSCDSGYCFT